jgi:ribonuclease BN (tRNA processing enzyme)
MTVTVLGCSGSYAAASQACTGFLVQSEAATVWLDAGPGTLANLQRHVGLRDLTAIVLSHEHPDHWLELPVVYSAVRYYEKRAPVPVFGTAGTLRLARALTPDLNRSFDWHVIADGAAAVIGDQQWRWSATDHYVETLACRVDSAGSSMVFSSDTGPRWQVGALGSGFDLALLESTYLADAEHHGFLHLSARQAGLQAAAANAKRLVLTHLAPGQDPDAHRRESARAYGGPVEVAAIDDRYLI